MELARPFVGFHLMVHGRVGSDDGAGGLEMGWRQQWVYRIEPSRFPPDFPERLERFTEAAGLSSRGLARRLKVDNRMLRRWRKGTHPNAGHLIALFNLAVELGLLHILLPAVGESQAVKR